MKAFAIALIIGLFFGFSLERAGFGSSRKLAGIFYFKDMTVLKVMFTALLTAMLGLSYCLAFGIVNAGDIFAMPTIYAAQIIGGLLFGIGFVIGAWCPGTAAVGMASGKIDAFVFLLGAVGGSVLFNELFGMVKPVYNAESKVRYVYDSLGVSREVFALIFTGVAVFCFWGAEYIEKKTAQSGRYFKSQFLVLFSLLLLVAAAGLYWLPANSIGSGDRRISR